MSATCALIGSESHERSATRASSFPLVLPIHRRAGGNLLVERKEHELLRQEKQ